MKYNENSIKFSGKSYSLALNNCFGYRNIFQNGVNALSKMVLKTCLFVCLFFFFVKRLKILCSLDHTILFQIPPACGPNTYQIMNGET